MCREGRPDGEEGHDGQAPQKGDCSFGQGAVRGLACGRGPVGAGDITDDAGKTRGECGNEERDGDVYDHYGDKSRLLLGVIEDAGEAALSTLREITTDGARAFLKAYVTRR